VVIDCSTIDISAQSIPALYDHQASGSCVVGQIESVTMPTAGRPPIMATGIFTPTDLPNDASKEVLAKADAGFRWQASVGGNPTSVVNVPAGQSVECNGRSYEGPLYIARGMKLREISFVVIGGDGRTRAVVASYQIEGAAMSFEEWLTSMGFDTESQGMMNEVQLANMKKLYSAEYGETETETEVVAEGEMVDPVKDPPTDAAAKPLEIKATADTRVANIKAVTLIASEAGNPKVAASLIRLRQVEITTEQPAPPPDVPAAPAPIPAPKPNAKKA
jgi:hypothetical protein